MNFVDRDSHHCYTEPDVITLKSHAPVQKCELIVFVLRDYSRVFIGGGEWGFDSLAREADTVEIEALAERFGWPELQKVLAKRPI